MIATQYIPKIGNENQEEFIKKWIEDNVTFYMGGDQADDGQIHRWLQVYETYETLKFEIEGIYKFYIDNINVELSDVSVSEDESLDVTYICQRAERINDNWIINY